MLSDARPSDHVVQFYETDKYLAEIVAPFLASNLRGGGVALVLCTVEHLWAIDDALRAAGFELERLRKTGFYVWRDARRLLAQLQVGAALDAQAFRNEIAALVGRSCANSAVAPIHVFGEIVDLLWAEGRTADAVQLEEMWNDLAREYSFNLLCAYRVTPTKSEAQRLRSVCNAHSHVLQPERPMAIRVSDDARDPPARRGAREMVRDVVKDQLIPVQRTDGGEQRIGNADQHIGDGLRDRLAPEIFLAMMQARGIKAQAPVELTPQIDELIEKLDRALQTTLAYAEESSPRPVGASLYDAVLTYAAMTERLFDVTCMVTVTRTFCDPDRVQRELLYSLIREVIERAARDRGAREMTVELSRHRERHQLAIYHDGDRVVVLGSHDDRLRQLIYQVRTLGATVDVRPRSNAGPQLLCRW